MQLEGDDLVQFRLLYSGNQLVSNGGPAEKHKIRKLFHPQLKQLWGSNASLKKLSRYRGAMRVDPSPCLPEIEQDDTFRTAYFNEIGDLYQRGNFRFVPLIDIDLRLRVSIDILFLRPDQHPIIKEGGDIDNRLKTLFDAFRVPETTAGLGGIPGEGEDPFFVLLQDDSLISEIRVNTDNLLMLPAERTLDAKDTFLVIDVSLKPDEKSAHNWAFE
jgi:hypothetical protein